MKRGRRHLRARFALGAAAAAAALFAVTGCDLQENADTDRGEALFVENCGGCHTLAAAGTNANVGPNLDAAFAAARKSGMDQDTFEGVVQAQIENPRPASPDNPSVYMPADIVTGADAEDVATYVASVAGTGAKPPEFSAPEFFATNCGSCHTLEAAGTTGTVGPNLDEVLPGQSAAQISESISDPDAMIVPGFQAGVMPSNFGDVLTPAQLRQLVQYLLQSVGG
jgi:mono/diheme cytochrome c family protein